MTRLDDMAGSAPGKAVAGAHADSPQESSEGGANAITPARAALHSITIGDLIGFLLKLVIASIAVALPLAVIFFFIGLVFGWFR